VDVLAETHEGTRRSDHRGGVLPVAGRGSDDRQGRDARAARLIQHGDQHAVTPLDRRTRGEDEIEIRRPVADHHEIHVQPSRRTVVIDHDGARHLASPEDAAERRRGDALHHLGASLAKHARGSLQVGGVPDEQGSLTRQHLMPFDEVDESTRAHDPGAIRSADRRDALVGAGRSDDGVRPDRPQRRIVDRRHDPVVPADGRRAVEEPDVGVTGARATGDRFEQRDADAAVRGLVAAATPDLPPPTTSTSTSISTATRDRAAEGRATGSRPRPPNPRITSR
jgi:hypothetical protein